MSHIQFDNQDQLEKIQAGLLPGEMLFAVYDGMGVGTGFIGLTDRRVIIQDNSLVGEKSALTSLPFKRIQSVSYVSDKWLPENVAPSSTVAIGVSGSSYEVEFQCEEKARHAHDVILHYVLHA